MTLDEAISHCDDVATKEKCEQCAQEHEQLAKWLNELKKYRLLYTATKPNRISQEYGIVSYRCPTCNTYLKPYTNRCWRCGQLMNWSD